MAAVYQNMVWIILLFVLSTAHLSFGASIKDFERMMAQYEAALMTQRMSQSQEMTSGMAGKASSGVVHSSSSYKKSTHCVNGVCQTSEIRQ
jgi:hypothetical protein